MLDMRGMLTAFAAHMIFTAERISKLSILRADDTVRDADFAPKIFQKII